MQSHQPYIELEKSHYPYIFVDKKNYVSVLMPVVGGHTIWYG